MAAQTRPQVFGKPRGRGFPHRPPPSTRMERRRTNSERNVTVNLRDYHLEDEHR